MHGKDPQKCDPISRQFLWTRFVENQNIELSIGETKLFSIGVFATFSKFVALADLAVLYWLSVHLSNIELIKPNMCTCLVLKTTFLDLPDSFRIDLPVKCCTTLQTKTRYTNSFLTLSVPKNKHKTLLKLFKP